MSDDELKREAEATVSCCSPYDPDCETCRHDAQRILAALRRVRDAERQRIAAQDALLRRAEAALSGVLDAHIRGSVQWLVALNEAHATLAAIREQREVQL